MTFHAWSSSNLGGSSSSFLSSNLASNVVEDDQVTAEDCDDSKKPIASKFIEAIMNQPSHQARLQALNRVAYKDKPSNLNDSDSNRRD